MRKHVVRRVVLEVRHVAVACVVQVVKPTLEEAVAQQVRCVVRHVALEANRAL